MLRFVFLFLAALSLVAASAACVRADVTIHVEDFEDEQGDPAFDPLFNHSLMPTNDNGYGSIIDGGIQFDRPNDWLLYLYYAQDTITFNLRPDQIITSASIEIVYPGVMSGGFVGERGEKLIDFPNPSFDPCTLEATWQEIGNISSLWLVGTSSIFNDITIEVAEVPELSAFCNLTLIGLLCGIVHVRKYGKAFLNH